MLARLEHGGPIKKGGSSSFWATRPVCNTYATFDAAHAELAGGRDVLAGIIETHQRKATAALQVGLPTLPLKQVVHQDIALQEFDIDACLARRSEIVLVDELAHTNTPGSRHRKRHQDVEELLDLPPSPLSERLVRTARRLAEALSAEWFALSVRTGQIQSAAAEARISKHLQLAESLGALTEVVSGLSIAEAVIGFAQENKVNKTVAGKPLTQGMRGWFGTDLVDQLIRHSGDIDVFVVSDKTGESISATPTARPPGRRLRYLQSVAAVCLTTALCFPISHWLGPINLVLLYLLVVTLVAYWLGRGPSALASALSVALFNVCFIPPYYTFVVGDKQYVVTFCGLLAVSLAISSLTGWAREQAAAARLREKETAMLLSFSRSLSQALTNSWHPSGDSLCLNAPWPPWPQDKEPQKRLPLGS